MTSGTGESVKEPDKEAQMKEEKTEEWKNGKQEKEKKENSGYWC